MPPHAIPRTPTGDGNGDGNDGHQPAPRPHAGHRPASADTTATGGCHFYPRPHLVTSESAPEPHGTWVFDGNGPLGRLPRAEGPASLNEVPVLVTEHP